MLTSSQGLSRYNEVKSIKDYSSVLDSPHSFYFMEKLVCVPILGTAAQFVPFIIKSTFNNNSESFSNIEKKHINLIRRYKIHSHEFKLLS